MEIDLIYLWVNGNDPIWKARKNAFLGIETTPDDANCEGRYADNEELRYSLRSVEKYAPWIRNIFIVTDNQTPHWLNPNHPKIHIIDHTTILPPEALPCYNSCVLEYFLYRIPGLSEHFLFGNDDMFLNTPLTPSFFFAPDGFPYIRLKRKPLGIWHYRWKKWTGKELTAYRTQIFRAGQLIQSRFGKFYSGLPHHNVDAYRKTDYQTAVETVFKTAIDRCITHHKRSPEDIQRVIFLYYALYVKHGHLKYIIRTESCTIDADNPDYAKRLRRFHPKLFCLNDNHYTSAADRTRIRPFLESLFPQPSAFESPPIPS
jgi:hypothetical protein